MLGLFFLLTLAWVLTLVYQKHARHYNTKEEDFIGVKVALIVIIQLAVMIFVFRYLSEMAGSNRSAPAHPSIEAPASKPLWKSLVPFSIIGLFGFILWRSFTKEVIAFAGRLLQNTPLQLKVIKVSAYVVFGLLVLAKIFLNHPVINNVYMFAIVLFAAQFGYMMSRKGCTTIFSAIVVLDVLLVWMASSGSTTGSGSGGGEPKLSWYVQMFRSDFMQAFPFPLGFQWGGRLIGNGDIFFTCFLVAFARRVYGLRAAVWCGILSTLPLLLLPFAFYILESPPPAWPYTIFIAPWALILTIFFRPKAKTADA